MPNEYQQWFTGEDISPRSVRGLRTWSVYSGWSAGDEAVFVGDLDLGVAKIELMGHNDQPWTVGENVAECLIPSYIDPSEHTCPAPYGADVCAICIHQDEWIQAQHQVADPQCQCGFYAYYTTHERGLEHIWGYEAVGVIQGWGNTTLGTKGFRTEFAEILAMYPAYAAFDPHMPNGLGETSFGSAPFYEAMKEQFPTIPVFRSMKEMVAEFPPSNPPDRKA